MERVGVAELKAALTVHLAPVKASETVIVTDHDRPSAPLVLITDGEEAEDRLHGLERVGTPATCLQFAASVAPQHDAPREPPRS